MTFWNFNQPKNKSEKSTLKMYGYIGRWSDIDERDFSEKMSAIGDNDLDVYVNSDGGSVFTALTIYNILSRHKGNITFYIDGIAASAMTLITSVPNAKVIAPTGSMMMVHQPLLDPMKAINKTEALKLADTLDKVGGSINAVYQKKTGLPEDKIEELLEAETYLTALEAVDLGFADEVEQQMDVAACISRDSMIINGLTLDPARHKNMPDAWFVKPEKTPNASRSAGSKTEALKEKKPMNLEELKAEHRELFEAVLAQGKTQGIEEERKRIQGIENSTMPGHEALAEKAKYSEPVAAEAFAMQVIAAERKTRANYIQNRDNDASEISGIDQAPPPENTRTDGESAEDEAARAEMRAAAKSVGNSRKRSIFSRKEG